MPVQIRPATRADEPSIQRVIRAVYDEYSFTWDEQEYHADLYDIDAHYLSLGNSFWVAELNGEVVGTVALERFDVLPGEPGTTSEFEGRIRIAATDCSLERLYVAPEARNHGVGSALMQETVRTAREEVRTGMEIWSDKRFTDAHRLYGRLGAAVIGDRICDDPDESPEWGLRLGL